ncbi:FUSC family protein [Streptomyces sp. PKU-EA00015]|uniref:FUSC family protein n=1 Tax=Streptomyces sp. PKU-EA00015 TaxID=2748326 RepID=UPI0015A1C480|nr:FUSC family protein [Streptomyces sp. PKU-EA00015]NWF25486.1 FUSC family protein [Streptomyces sp. PKU-EA00015]
MLLDAPPWLAHLFQRQRLPIPWAAVVRGAIACGPLLAAGLATGRAHLAVPAALGAMLAGVNDRPGTRRRGVVHIGLPALAGAFGMLLGSGLAPLGSGWWAVPVVCAVSLVSGAVSAAGPVSSAAGMQMLVAAIVGLGMPLPGTPGAKALYFLGGAGWLLLLRLLLSSRGRSATGPLSGEREAVAAVFDALADALAEVGRPGAEAARRQLTAALDRADEEVLLLRRLRVGRRRDGAALLEGFAAATALCEAAVALLWERRPLPVRICEGPRRLARAVRTAGRPGVLPAPASVTPACAAFHQALLDTAVAVAGAGPAPGLPARTPVRPGRGYRRRVLGPAGRDYGLRVALCVTASAAVALALRADHWYWLPATAAFLVKPDLGPLFSRTVNRFAGTAAGVAAFGAASSVFAGVWWPVATAGFAGALLPVATRHFAFQTSVVTVLVLSFVHVGGDTEVAGLRLLDTSIACGIVLLVGHLPRLGDPRRRVRHRTAAAVRRTERYLRHVLATVPGQPAGQRPVLRRAAYTALAGARSAAGTASAELPPRGVPGCDWQPLLTTTERIVDATTAYAVHLAYGSRPPAAAVHRLARALSAAADTLDQARDLEEAVGRSAQVLAAHLRHSGLEALARDGTAGPCPDTGGHHLRAPVRAH